jgi:hypothetical protein
LVFVAHRALAILRRRLFDFLTILSLLLCLATAALWVRSYWACYKLTYVRPDSQNRAEFIWMGTNYGELSLGSTHQPMGLSTDVKRQWGIQALASDPRTYEADTKALRTRNLGQSASAMGFGYVDYGKPTSFAIRAIWFPHWFPALLFAILPALRLRSILRTRRRHLAGLCPHCGYDLRATPDRCPECGHVPKALAGR